MAARRTPAKPPAPPPTVVEATELAIKAAEDAQRLLPEDAAAVAALRVLARKIEALGEQEAGVSADGELKEERKAQPLDNVTVPTFLKYLDALGLTPAGRKALSVAGKTPAGGGQVVPESALERLRREAQAKGGKAS